MKIKLLNIFIFLVNLLACGLLPAQSGIDKELLSQLEAELFPQNPEWIPIREYPGCNIYELKVDSAAMVRRVQPDYKKVQLLLKQTAYSGDYNYFEPLMSLYQRHQENFRSEWEYLHSKNKYDCDIRIDQVAIMFAFENTLKALEWAQNQITSEKIWKEYQKERELNYKLLYRNGASYYELTSQYEYYFEYFREVRRIGGSWFAYPVSFMPYSVFIDNIQSFLVEEIRAFDPANLWQIRAEGPERRAGFNFIFNMREMNYYKSEAIEDILIDKFADFMENNQFEPIYSYVRYNKNISNNFIILLVDNLFSYNISKEVSIHESQAWFKSLIFEHTSPLIREYFMGKLASQHHFEKEMALLGLGNFPEKEILEIFIAKAKSNKTSLSEREILRYNLESFRFKENFSGKELKQISSALKSLAK